MKGNEKNNNESFLSNYSEIPLKYKRRKLTFLCLKICREEQPAAKGSKRLHKI